jgi:hypothetical protein
MAYLKQIPTSIVTWVVAILAALSAIPCAAASPQYPSTDAIDVKDVLEVAQESASIFEVDAPGSEALVPFKAAPTPTEFGNPAPSSVPSVEFQRKTNEPVIRNPFVQPPAARQPLPQTPVTPTTGTTQPLSPIQQTPTQQPPTQWSHPAPTVNYAPPAQLEIAPPTITATSTQSGRYPLFETPAATSYAPPAVPVHSSPAVSPYTPPVTNPAFTSPTPSQPQAQFVAPEVIAGANNSAAVIPAISETNSVGHRRPWPIKRASLAPLDDGEKFEYEKKKRDYPPFSEIIATGRFFYSAEVLWGEPQFQGNNAFNVEGPNFGQAFPFDFDSDFHPRVRMGFESKYGPGVELTYFNLNSNSELSSFTSDGTLVGHANAWVLGRNQWSRIFADDPGETLVAQHSIDIDSATISFFKELKFPISRINGNFGFQYVSIAQELNANVNDASGGSVESLRSVTDMRAFGPRVILEYYRPVGHTPLEFITAFGGSVLFGQRDQFVTNSQTGLQNRVGADEFITVLDFTAGLQYTKTIGENRSWFARLGFVNQTWLGGGTAVLPQGDFGVRGLSFGIGYNR